MAMTQKIAILVTACIVRKILKTESTFGVPRLRDQNPAYGSITGG